MYEFELEGLPGVVGSTDATHITTWNWECNLQKKQ